MEHTSCMEDRIHHGLDRCLYGLSPTRPITQPCNNSQSLPSPNTLTWNAGLCLNLWSLEELVRRDPQNFLILLQQILRKTKEVLEHCQYEQVAPLTLLFSSTLLQTPHLPSDCGVLQEAWVVFHCFLSWPEPCCSASRDLLSILHQELRAPGVSFHKLVRKEQGLVNGSHSSKTITVLLVSPGEDFPPEVLSVSEQLSGIHHSQWDTSVTLIKHAFQAALGDRYPLHTLHTALQSKETEELEQILFEVTEAMETAAASTEDPASARERLLKSLGELSERLGVHYPDGRTSPGAVQTLRLPLAKCQVYPWDKDNFDILNDILAGELDQAPVLKQSFSKDKGEGNNDIDDDDDDDDDEDEEGEKVEEEEEEEEEEIMIIDRYTDHRISATSSTSSRDSMLSSYSLSSSWSVPSTLSESSGVDSDFSEVDEGQPEPGRVRGSKSKALLVNRFSMLFKSRHSPSACRRAQSMGYRGDVSKDVLKRSKSLPRQVRLTLGSRVPSPTSEGGCPSPQSHVCFRRRPILSCEEVVMDGKGQGTDVCTRVRVVVFGEDREAGRLARAYRDLQQRESRCPRLTKACKLQFYFVPVRRRSPGAPGGGRGEGRGVGGGGGHTTPEGHSVSPLKGTSSMESSGVAVDDSTTDIAQLIGMVDPWYERSVLSLLSLSSEVLCQVRSKVECDSGSSSLERLPLLADLVLYYCRHAAKPVLVQLYQAELTLAGGDTRTEVFIHSLDLGHAAGTRAVKAMGAASKRFGIDGDREAVPLTLEVAYNKVAVSRRSQWTQTKMVCTSINLRKGCKTPELLDSRIETLQLTMTEVLKRQSFKSKMSYNQQISNSEVNVDHVQVSGGNGTTFAVCLDQDEKKIIQSVIRCEVSLCSKPESSSDWKSHRSQPGQVRPLHLSYRSLLCLPIASFCGSHP